MLSSRKKEVFCFIVLMFLLAFYLTRTLVIDTIQTSPVKTISLKDLLIASIEVSQRGGAMVRKVKENKNLQVKSKGKTLEGVNDPVTLGDMLSHKQMYYSLLKMWPDLRIVSEEKSDDVPDVNEIEPIDLNADQIVDKLSSTHHADARLQDVTVWIDPLDATQEYTEGLLEYVTTMVCVAHKGEPVIGVIHSPFLKKTVWGWVGHGRSDIPEYQTNLKEVHQNEAMRIIVSRAHAGKVKEIAKKAFGENSKVTPAGGAGYKALNVAQRKADAYIHTTAIKKWDICAGNALLKTMGGEMTDLNGHEIDYDFPGFRRKNVKLKSGLIGTFKDHFKILSKIKQAS